MHTTGKISDANLKSISITRTSAGIGARRIVLTTTKMVALTSTDVITVMGGRSKSITLRALSLIHASMEINVLSHIAHTIIMIRTRDSRFNSFSRYSLKLE
jgi:hypothetical protein